VRPVAAAIIDQTTTGPGNFYNRMRRLDLGVEQTFGRLQLDYNALYTRRPSTAAAADAAVCWSTG
jgi:hypothetical protein